MAYTDLKLEQDGTVLKITVDRPEVLNAQSRIMREELDDAFDKAADDESVKVVIIAGAGTNFSAGHDLGSPQEMPIGKNVLISQVPRESMRGVGNRM